MKKFTFYVCLAFLTAISGQGQIAAWDFYGQSFPVTCAATTFQEHLVTAGGANNITRGPGAPASGGVHSFRTTGFQNNGISTDNSDYFQVTLQPVPGYKLSLSTLDARFNGTTSFFASPGVTSQFAYSLDGVNFVLIGNPVESTSLTMAQVNLTGIPDLQDVFSETMVTIRYYASGQTTTGGWGFYSVSPGTNGLAIGGNVTEAVIAAPTVQASDIAFSNVQQTQMGVSWTPGNGLKRVVKINTVNSFTAPADGTDPPASPVYSGSGEQVVYNYSGASIPAVTGLTTGTTYWYRVYEYNGSGTLTMYNIQPATGNPESMTTSAVLLPPSISSPTATAVTPGSAILGGHVTADGGSPVTGRGTVWKTSSPVLISDNKLPEGGTDTGYFNHLRTSFSPATQIFYAAYATNAIGTTLTQEASFFTSATEPPAHVTEFAAATAGTTAIALSWVPLNTGADGYLILKKQGTDPPAGVPTDANGYSPGEVIGDGLVAAIITPGTAEMDVIDGLSPGTVYSFTIFPFTWDGVNAQTTNYHTQVPVPWDSAATGIPSAATYHWSGAAGIDWNAAGNWVPMRTIPSLNDILVFDAGGTWTIINVPAQTIGQLKVSSGTGITLQGSGTLNIEGDAGEDLEVASGCHLNISGAGAVSISLAAGATGIINGSMALSGGGHRLMAASANGMIFASGSTFKAGSGFTGNPFGTVNLNSVVFNSGSVYICQAGGNPFGATAPSSVVVFRPGSLYRVDAYAVPSFGGRTYGNFEMNYPGSITVTGSSAVSIGNFTASQGTFYINMTGAPGHSIKGNIFIAGVATLIIAPATAGTVMLNGSIPQTISGSGSFMAGPFSTLVFSNSAGVTLDMNATFNNLTITNGGSFTISPGRELTVNGDLITGAPASGFIIEPDGSLIHGSPGVTGTVKRSFSAATWTDPRDGWHFLSSPVAGQAIDPTGGFITTGAGNDFDLYLWSEPGDLWINYKNTTTAPLFTDLNGGNVFATGKGYLSAYQQAGDKVFSGVLNVADVPVENLTSSGPEASNRGWHLLGNPFPCALTWYTGWTTSNIGGVASIWNEEGRSYSPRNPGEPIPACNAFMVKVEGNAGTYGSLTIPASQRIHSSQPWYKETGFPVIRLVARDLDQPSFQESQIRFNPLSTKNFDVDFDGRYLPGYAPVFYSVSGEEKLMVNSLPGTEENMYVPLIFEKKNGDHFRIEAEISGNISPQVLLTDKKTGTVHNLTNDPVYGFTADEGDESERFGITFIHADIAEPSGQKTHVYAHGNAIMINHPGNTRVEIFGITGECLVVRDLTGTATGKLILEAPEGIYLVRVSKGDRVAITKVLIH